MPDTHAQRLRYAQDVYSCPVATHGLLPPLSQKRRGTILMSEMVLVHDRILMA
jgi:hypothetical protein